MKAYKTILPFIRENFWRYLAGILALCLVDIASLLQPQLLKTFADKAQVSNLSFELVSQTAYKLFILGLLISVGRYFWRVNIFGTARKIEYWLRKQLFNHYLCLDDAFYQDHQAGDLMAHATNDVFMIRNSMGPGIIMIVDASFMTLLTIFMMVRTVGFKTAAVALITLPLITLFVFLMTKPLRQRSREVQDYFSEMSNEVEENISAIHNIKAFNIEDNRLSSFEAINLLYQKKNISLLRLGAAFDPMISLISGLAFVIFILYGLHGLARSSLTLGDFIAVIQYVRLLIWPMIAMAMVVGSFQRGIASMERINEILASRPGITEVKNPKFLDVTKLEIEFQNVSFCYDRDQGDVLKNISFKTNSHKSLAIIGPTGCGKSTIMNLLLRRYDVSSGRILINGHDIRELALADIYRALAPVQQESFIFQASLAENIAFVQDAEINLSRVKEAASFAAIDEEINQMADGYDSLAGERGANLSGGQRQRLAIARAYYQKKAILILDDALSAVDTNTEHKILVNLKDHDQGLIIVSQRISTIQGADEILVLESGQISQRGKHKELMKDKSGFYARLYQRQLVEKSVEDDYREGGRSNG